MAPMLTVLLAVLHAVLPVAHAQSPAGNTEVSVSTHSGAQQSIDEVHGRILTIFSYDPGMEWVKSLIAGLEDGLSTLPNIEHNTEFLDAKRHPALTHSEAFLNSLRAKYHLQQPDVLMISDDPAFELLRDKLPELFPGVPVVFFGLNKVRHDLPPSFTGIYEVHEATPTLEIAMQLTNASGVAVISNTTETGKAHEHTLDAARKAYPDLEWVFFRDIVSDDLSSLQALPDDWPILPVLGLRQARADGPMVPISRTAEIIRDQLPNPMFWSTESLMGRGVVGGYILRGEVHGRQALELAVQILHGADPSEIPAIIKTPHEWRFDWRELKRRGWLDQTPSGAELLFAPPPFIQRHREILEPIALALLSLLAVIGTLIWHLRSERRHARKLKSETQRLAAALLAADAGVFEIKVDGTTLNSTRWLQMFDSQELQASSLEWLKRLTEKSSAMLEKRFQSLRDGADRESLEIELESPRKLIQLMLMRDGEEPETAGIVGIGIDVTNRRRAEQQEVSRARLHSLGQLAGGVAHDFNNLLMVIVGNAEMIPVADSPEMKDRLADSIVNIGMKAETLTKRLLTFGRVEEQDEPPNADLNYLVNDLYDLLKDMAKGCDVVLKLSELELSCKVSSSTIDQILTNLVANARDAMSGQGDIIIETLKHKNEQDELFAVLRVRDEGEGMDPNTIEHLFEPFFSTKGVGRGTGLGLSTVYGLVSSSGGNISVDSTKGVGSTFEISWPLFVEID